MPNLVSFGEVGKDSFVKKPMRVGHQTDAHSGFSIRLSPFKNFDRRYQFGSTGNVIQGEITMVFGSEETILFEIRRKLRTTNPDGRSDSAMRSLTVTIGI